MDGITPAGQVESRIAEMYDHGFGNSPYRVLGRTIKNEETNIVNPTSPLVAANGNLGDFNKGVLVFVGPDGAIHLDGYI